MTQKNGCTTTPLPAQALEVKALYFTKGAGDKYLSVYAQYGGDPAWVPLQVTIPATPDLQQVRDMDRNIAIDSGSYEDAHMYLRSADGNNMTAAFFTNAAGGGIQVGNAAGLAPLHLQADGGLLTYGGDEVATKTWVDQQPAPGLQATTDAGNETSHELMIKGVRFGVGKTGGFENVAVGRNALENTSTGANYNVALGSGSMEGAVSANNSTAVGEITLASNAAGSCNSAFGNSAMYGNTSGDNNTAVGVAAGLTNHPRGRGNFNLFLGRSAGQVEEPGSSTLGDNNIMIGYQAGKDSYGDSQLRIGNKNEVTGEHIIEGDMAARTLVFNSTLAVNLMVPYTSGGYSMVVWNNASKRYETVDPVTGSPIVNNGYYYGNVPEYTGWDTGGGFATGATMYFQNEVIEPAARPHLHCFVCLDDNDLALPDAEAWKGRILEFKCISLDRSTTRTLSFTGAPLRDYNNVLSAFTYDKLSLSAAIKSSLNPATGTWEWECLSAQHNIF